MRWSACGPGLRAVQLLRGGARLERVPVLQTSLKASVQSFKTPCTGRPFHTFENPLLRKHGSVDIKSFVSKVPSWRTLVANPGRIFTRSVETVVKSTGPESRVYCPNLQGTKRKLVGWWCLGCAGVTATIIVVGAVTRLTESGLSMVRWEPIKGIWPPTTEEEWEKEFEQYKQFPEYKYTHKGLTLEEFKHIFFWEYFHRLLGRSLGIVFGLPALYVVTRPNVTGLARMKLIGAVVLLGFQGALGWYMVKSGLEEQDDPNWIPRVSQYRLAAHMTTALAMLALLVSTGASLLIKPTQIPGRRARVLWHHVHGSVLLTFFTAVSGAFVAGLDAGLVYNSFPKFANRWVPEDLLTMDPKWKNATENATAVQFNHRILGMTTLGMVCAAWSLARPVNLPKNARLAANTLLGLGLLQVTLGISTLLLYVPVSLAAAHQAGALCLLSNGIWLMHELKETGRNVGIKPVL